MPVLTLFIFQSQQDMARAQAMIPAAIAGFFIIGLILIALVLIPVWFICKKAGFSPWLSLLCLIPSIGLLVLLYVLAFADWKVVPPPQMGYMPPAPYPPQPLPPQV